MFSDMNLILNMNLGDPWHVEIRGDKMVNVAFSPPTPPQSSYQENTFIRYETSVLHERTN